MAVGTEGGVEVVGHGFGGEVGDGPNAMERQAARLGETGNTGGLHFHGDGARGAKAALFRGGPGHVVDGADHAGVMGGNAGHGPRGIVPTGSGDGGRHDHVSHGELGSERATKPRADHHIRGKGLGVSVRTGSRWSGVSRVIQ